MDSATLTEYCRMISGALVNLKDVLHDQSMNDIDVSRKWADAKADELKRRIAEVSALAKNKEVKAELREYAKGMCESVANTLPNITKAAIDGVAAFQKGDAITGSAAMMDICAAAAPLLGTVLSVGSLLGAAGGPAGMLAGALFSIVSQILMALAPKGDSMLEQIERLLEKLEQKGKVIDIKTVQGSISDYAKDVRLKSTSLFRVLQKPLMTEHDCLDFDRVIHNMQRILEKGYPQNQVTLFANWEVIEWLKMPENQDMDRWPEILGLFCKAYTDLMTANLLISTVIASPDLQARMNEVSPESANSLSAANKDHLKWELNHLKASGEGYLEAYKICNSRLLNSLHELLPVARNRGLFFILAGGHVHAGTGKNAIERNKWSTELWNYCRRISITVPGKEDPPLAPCYHFWALEGWHQYGGDAIWHGRFDSRKLADTSAGRETIVVEDDTLARGRASEFSDIVALPNSQDREQWVYLSHGNAPQGGDVELFRLDGKKKSFEGNWRPPTKSPLMQVRLVTPLLTLQDDPEKDLMPALLLQGVDHYNSILYGTLRDSAEIYVDRENARCYIPSPVGAYRGISVDSYLLWVFGPAGCKCASHASIMGYLAGKRDAPTWLAVPSLDEHKDLIDLSSCDDETLFISAANALWTTSYQIDFEKKKIEAKPWTRFAGAGAEQVQKLPIPCWNLLESLSADLAGKVRAAGA